MKSELVIQAEQEARQACEGLGHTEEQIQAFVEEHIGNELRRDAEKAKELQRPKRNADLTAAIINIAVDPFRRSDECFPAYKHKDEPHGASLGYPAENQRDEDTYQRQRNRGET